MIFLLFEPLAQPLRQPPILMSKNYDNRVAASVQYIKSKIDVWPAIGVILGSGLGDFGEVLVDKTSLRQKTSRIILFLRLKDMPEGFSSEKLNLTINHRPT